MLIGVGVSASWVAMAAAMAAQIGQPSQSAPARGPDAPRSAAQDDPCAPVPVEIVPVVGPGAPGNPQADVPIIPDAQFQQQLPSLSTDINAPLEPMSAIAGAPSTPSATATSVAAGRATAPVQGTAPQDEPITGDTLPPPAAPAPELAQPLTPLPQFSATPPAEIADQPSGDNVQIRYSTVVRGLDEVHLTSQFEALSALRNGHGRAANATMVSARAREDEGLAGRLMRSIGYYDGTAVSSLEQTPGQGTAVRAIVSATTGHLYHICSITIDAPPVVPADLISHNLPLRIGDPLEAARIQGAEANVALVLPQQGYPFTVVGQRDILLDERNFSGAYTLPVTPGPRSSFGVTTSTGHEAFDNEHVALLARFQQGQLYDSRLTDDLRQALVATGLFSTVSVVPTRTGQPGPDGTELVNLAVTQEAGPSRTLAGNAGYSTGQGIRAEATYTLRNLFPPEGALIFNAIAGTQEQGLGATFRRSNAGRRDRTFTAIASADHANYDAFSAFTSTLSVRWSYDSTPIWQKRITYSYGAELTGTNESVYDFGRGERVRRTYGIVALPGQIQWDTSDNLLNPTRGYRLRLTLSPETSVQGSVSPYARTMVEGTYYQPIGTSIVLAGRLRAGSIVGIDRDDLAPSRRYYGGGGGSVRGYGFQRLGPRDPNGDPVGGRSLNEGAFEVRYRTGNIGVVPFFDIGQSYASSLPKGSDLRAGAGIGVRYYTNFGPFRIDVATPLNRQRGDSLIALYLSIGQAF